MSTIAASYMFQLSLLFTICRLGKTDFVDFIDDTDIVNELRPSPALILSCQSHLYQFLDFLPHSPNFKFWVTNWQKLNQSLLLSYLLWTPKHHRSGPIRFRKNSSFRHQYAIPNPNRCPRHTPGTANHPHSGIGDPNHEQMHQTHGGAYGTRSQCRTGTRRRANRTRE